MIMVLNKVIVKNKWVNIWKYMKYMNIWSELIYEIYDSFEKTLMLGKIEGRKRRGRQRRRWWYSITNSMDMGLGGLRELVMDREAWHAAVCRVTKSQTWLSDWTELHIWNKLRTRYQCFNTLWLYLLISHIRDIKISKFKICLMLQLFHGSSLILNLFPQIFKLSIYQQITLYTYHANTIAHHRRLLTIDDPDDQN